MAIDKNDLMSLKRKLAKLRAEYRAGQDNEDPPSIKFLRSLRTESLEDSEFIVLTTLLESECSRFGLLDECESLKRQMVARFPDDPVPWIGLAGFLLHFRNDPEEARTIVEMAIEKAEKKGHFLRHAYNTRARIARQLGDYSLLEDTLEKLITYRPGPNSQDIGYERDFLVDLPPGVVLQAILDDYELVASRSRKMK